MKTVFIAHQVAGDVTVNVNIRSALCWARWALKTKNVVPVVPYAYLCQILDDSNPDERQIGMVCSMEILRRCEEVWICGPIPNKDSQVWVEVREAQRMNKTIIDYTDLELPKEYADFSQT